MGGARDLQDQKAQLISFPNLTKRNPQRSKEENVEVEVVEVVVAEGESPAVGTEALEKITERCFPTSVIHPFYAG